MREPEGAEGRARGVEVSSCHLVDGGLLERTDGMASKKFVFIGMFKVLHSSV